jgi:hypothetical protein
MVQDDDIYNEIEYEDLRGPAAAATIALDVQENEEATNGDKGDVLRGILPGRSEEVRGASSLPGVLYLQRVDARYTDI